ncbi:DUF5103 domain-containing protein [Flaviaesturariibacter aridisoli]|uniref:DUF5103 domain-containing protein n=1 Tax=Flaviaesturariibacter aridisoli TaxID=2545761 RepID=A0A4R4E6I8_9BACT|nr:DUF5103 domain-containing protein [Flaviaesturariibacter aridisoli]TCZ73305.1 DUF5103 domain-containing protein [Flaviaesturariibacter aridisoli]
MNRILALTIVLFSCMGNLFARPEPKGDPGSQISDSRSAAPHFRLRPSDSPTSPVGDIHSAKLYRPGDQTSFPMIALGSIESLELHFDDMEADVKNYYYSYQLCDADWTPSVLHTFEYIRGFANNRISNYRISSITSSRYTHYQAVLPDRNCQPMLSGNYLLRVFINGDTSQIAFTKRFVVYENKAKLAVQLLQPYNAAVYNTHHKLHIGITPDNNKLNLMGPQDFTVVILQNNNWVTSKTINQPTIYRGNYYEYSDESITAMPAGMEWRWLDLRSLRLMSERVEKINSQRDTTQVYVKTDAPRNGNIRVQYRDNNGAYSVEAIDNLNPFWQSEYGNVHFSFRPPGGTPYKDRDVYIFGELTGWLQDAPGPMTFNEERGVYESELLLKQGYYNYLYVTVPKGQAGPADFSGTEGNNWVTDNQYTVLVYYRAFGARYDAIVSAATVTSVFGSNR